MNELMNKIQSATLNLRKRHGHDEFGVHLNQGKAQVVWIDMNVPKGRTAKVTPVSRWVPVPDVVSVLDSIMLKSEGRGVA